MGQIYLITNLINQKKYIGQTKNSIEQRWAEHCRRAKRSTTGSELYLDIQKYGPENFKCEVLEECPINELCDREIYYIKKLNTYQGDSNKGYNQTRGGIGSTIYEIEEEEIVSMYNQGQSAGEIAKQFNCSDGNISKKIRHSKKTNKGLHNQKWIETHPELVSKTLSNLKKGSTLSGHHFTKGEKAKRVRIIELNKDFNSLEECSRWLISNNYTKTSSINNVRKALSRHLHNERTSYLNMHFIFI